ncbi:MAG: zinc ABC transporter substrate-binding protein [Hyphomicrobiales bacterium]
MRLTALSLAALLAVATPALAGPRVIASVVPLHGIVAAVMGDTGTPELLLEGRLSEHRATFSARQIADLGQADLVFIVGHGLEAKLAQISGSEAVNGKTFIEVSDAPGVTTLPIRQGGAWEPHHHDDDDGDDDHAEGEAGHDHDQEGVLSFDPHVWLDPENAKAIAAAVAASLSKADPGNAGTYAANAKTFAQSLDSLESQISAELAPVKDKPFIVFHDGYQYFEHRFGLTGAGSITDISAQAPSAERLQQIRDKLAATRAECVFREPQYDDKVVNVVIEGSSARSGVLDGLGSGVTPGPAAYQDLLKRLADDFRACFPS